MADRCERTDLLVDQCAHCRRDTSLEEQAAAETAAEYAAFVGTHRAWFPSRFPGSCGNCGRSFQVGVPITGSGSWRDSGWKAFCCRGEP